MGVHKNTAAFVATVCVLVLVPVGFLVYLYHTVTGETAVRIERGAIERIIASESPVYYDDGKTPIGMFFEKTHRKYIRFREIPKVFVKALVATEDHNFFSHHGVDVKAVLRALVANVRAGRVVQGGSTITQQTAKNIFRREKRSYKAKLKELMQAFLLEREYSKEEIFEMYANQFFVTGYGKGLRIAAQYFFGKEVEDLDLVEAAFIAGSFKGPNRYNPFIKATEEEKREARRLAKLRKDHVLSSMAELDFITDSQLRDARAREVPFKEGTITYRLNVVLGYVRDQLDSDYFRSVLREQGVDNIATSGIGIYTSIDKDIQSATLESLRTHLPVIDVRLSGWNRTEPGALGLSRAGGGLPFMCRITQIEPGGHEPRMVVAWDNGGGIIEYNGLRPMGDAWLKWKRGPWASFDTSHLPEFLSLFRVGELVPVRFMKSPDAAADTLLVLTRVPELEGGAVVLHRGMLKAMVGGYMDRFFNRAVDAKRQLGSVFKPFVYTAALQLKWNTLDPLPNRRDLYRFEDTSYVPRPDHTPEHKRVSMMWAGVKSENLATVWMLYHLTDQLTLSEFRTVTDAVGLGRREGESYTAYKMRIRDTHGVVVDDEALREAAFEEAKNAVRSDVIFGARGRYDEMLETFDMVRYRVDRSRNRARPSELGELVRFDFSVLASLNGRMTTRWDRMERALAASGEGGGDPGRTLPPGALEGFYRIGTPGREDMVAYFEQPDHAVAASAVPLTAGWLAARSRPLAVGDIRIDGIVSSRILDQLAKHTGRVFERLAQQNRYDLGVLSMVRDFRTLVNLSYVRYLCREMGIHSPLEPALSLPLGPHSISILEAARAYHTIMTGKTYPLPGGEAGMVPVITRIVDREGVVLWEYTPAPKTVLSPRVTALVGEILRNVVENGTGRAANKAVRFVLEPDENLSVPIPSYGKTGTSNRFTNSSFVGFVPGPDEATGRLDTHEGYVIAGYVGYDDNRPMKSEHTTVYGASGALPLWVDTANAVVKSRRWQDLFNPADLIFTPEAVHVSRSSLRKVPVSAGSGLPAGADSSGLSGEGMREVFADVEDRGGSPVLKRAFEPMGGRTE